MTTTPAGVPLPAAVAARFAIIRFPMSVAIKAMSTMNRGIYRLTGGRLGGRIGQAPILLLTTVGRKSGKSRTSPLLYLTDGDDLVVVASYGGNPTHPTWFVNLEANPEVEVEVGRERSRWRARIASGEERERLWARLVEMYPAYARYAERTARTIPVVILEPR